MNDNDNRVAVSASHVEPSATGEALHQDEYPSFNTPVNIKVISYRKYKHDTDGVSVKAVLDGLVAVGILAGDTSEHVKEVTFESRKSKDESTLIVIEDVK